MPTMQAIVHRKYGPPDVLTFETIERPVAGVDDVLIRVHAACATIGDHHVVTGKPYLIRLSPFGGLPRPKNRVPGALPRLRSGAVAVSLARRSRWRFGRL